MCGKGLPWRIHDVPARAPAKPLGRTGKYRCGLMENTAVAVLRDEILAFYGLNIEHGFILQKGKHARLSG
jgi:hypothetical protein